MNIGRRLYYDAITGEIIVDTGDREGSVIPKTIEEDITTYVELSERNPNSFKVTELEFGEFGQDFKESVNHRINATTGKLEFSYPDPNTPAVEPVYEAPLTERIMELEASYMYDSMMKDMVIDDMNNGQAEMMYQLMMKGVI